MRDYYSRDYFNDPTVMEDYMETPDAIQVHAKDYHNKAWEQYSLQELGMWVHLLIARAQHRTNKEKAAKDIYDAQNYLTMMQEHIEAAKQFCLPSEHA